MAIKLAAMVVAVVALATRAQATTIVSVDGWAPGDNEIIQDNATGLQWLKLTVTNDVSTASFKAGYGMLSMDGFQIADQDDVSVLFQHFGAPAFNGIGTLQPVGLSIVNGLRAAFGCTTCQWQNDYSNPMWYGEGILRIDAGYGYGFYEDGWPEPPQGDGPFIASSGTMQTPSDNNATGGRGIWLFRSIPTTDTFLLGSDPTPFFEPVIGAPGVPEPATWTMLIFGLFGIGYLLRRRHQGKPAHAMS